MPMFRPRTFFLATLAMLLAACATQTRLVDTWQDAELRPAPLRRLLIVGIGEDGAGRRLFEDAFVSTLKARGVEAVPSYSLASGVHEADTEKIRELVARVAADGVLATRLVVVDQRTATTPGQVTAVPRMAWRRDGSAYYAGTVIVQSPPVTRHYGVVRLETNLWQVVGERLLWSGATESTDSGEAHRGSPALADTIADALRERGLI